MSFLKIVKFIIASVSKLPPPFLLVVIGGLLILIALAVKRIFF